MPGVDLVQFCRNVAAAGAGANQLEPPTMDLDVRLPQAQRARTRLAEEQRPLERLVVAGNHREAIQAEDVAGPDHPRGDRVVGAVGVDARLKPGPGVHQLGVGVAPRDFPHHRLGRVQRDFVFGNALTDCLHTGASTHVADRSASTNQGVLLLALHHAHAHGGGADIDESRLRQRHRKLVAVLEGDVVELDPYPGPCRNEFANRDEEVVLVPVRVDEVVAETLAPRLSVVDVGADCRVPLRGDDESVAATEGAVDEIREVVEVVDGSEEHRVDRLFRHVLPKLRDPRAHFLGRECWGSLLAVLQHQSLRSLHAGIPPSTSPGAGVYALSRPRPIGQCRPSGVRFHGRHWITM